MGGGLQGLCVVCGAHLGNGICRPRLIKGHSRRPYEAREAVYNVQRLEIYFG